MVKFDLRYFMLGVLTPKIIGVFYGTQRNPELVIIGFSVCLLFVLYDLYKITRRLISEKVTVSYKGGSQYT